MQKPSIIKNDRIALFQQFLQKHFRVVGEIGELSERRVECGRSGKGERCLEGRGVVDVGDVGRGPLVKFDGGVGVVEVVAVVDVLKGHGRAGEDVECVGVGGAELRCGIEAVGEVRLATHNGAIADTVEELVLGWVVQVSVGITRASLVKDS